MSKRKYSISITQTASKKELLTRNDELEQRLAIMCSISNQHHNKSMFYQDALEESVLRDNPVDAKKILQKAYKIFGR